MFLAVVMVKRLFGSGCCCCLAFFGVSFSLLLTGGDFPTARGVSAGGFSEGVGGTSGVRFSSDKFTGHLTGICAWGRCCTTVTKRGLRSRLFRLILLLVLSLAIQYEFGEVFFDSVYPGFHSSIREPDGLVRQVGVIVPLHRLKMCWSHAETDAGSSAVE